ncbi:MAG TPA: LLM class F420-dependent oxidoreductase [Acidimicrobiia bacterium]|nr:LLM class F420-dependent oxidoreductase [Acidimicrobiia bacterium]
MAGFGFGCLIPQGWKMDLVAVGDDPQAKWAKVREVALAAEAAGYDSIWVYDHFHNVPRPAHEAVFECWTTMAALAEATSTVRLGQMVGCAPYRNPGLLAKITSNVDVISGGRLEWGIGAGWYENEFRGYGYDFPPAADRIRMLEEAVEIVKSMWSESETTYEGRYYQLERANCDPKPVQQPHPPIWIGGGGEQMTLRVVAKHADCSNWGGKPHEWAHKAEVLKGHCADVGRDYDEIRKTWHPDCVIRETEDEVKALHEAGEVRSLWGEPYESWQAGNLIGTPEQVVEQLRRYEELGCSYVVPFFPDYPGTESLTLLAERVMPEFR